MFNRKKITPDIANIWLCNGNISKQEHADFFVNYCFQAMVPEKLRKSCRLQELQCNGHGVNFNPAYLTPDECKELGAYLLDAIQCALDLSQILTKHLRVVNTNRTIDKDLRLKSFEKSLTFDEVSAILQAEMQNSYSGDLCKSLSDGSYVRNMIPDYIARLRRALLVCASVYQMTITFFGARV